MGVHESQSLLWERMVGLSPPFCSYFLDKAKGRFPSLAQADSTALYQASPTCACACTMQVRASRGVACIERFSGPMAQGVPVYSAPGWSSGMIWSG